MGIVNSDELKNKTVPLFDRLSTLVDQVPGWTPLDQLYTLSLLVFQHPGKVENIVEVGCWCGRSSIALALGAELRGEGKVNAVDLFPGRNDWYENEDGSFSFKVTTNSGHISAYTDQRVWREPWMESIKPVYDKFENTFEALTHFVERANLSHRVTTFKGDITSFTKAEPDLKAQLVFLDADHSYDAVSNDILHAQTILEPGGWLAFDDAFTVYEGVNQAIKDLVLNSTNFQRCQQVTRKCFIAQKAS